jgi:hypothetical protein
MDNTFDLSVNLKGEDSLTMGGKDGNIPS